MGQKMKLLGGSIRGMRVLSEQKAYHIRFTYDSMSVGTDAPEKMYLARKKDEWDLKEDGRGSDFVEMWFDSRHELYEPAFIANFEKYSKIKLDDRKAPYTLIVKTYNTEGGWNAGLTGHQAEISGEFWVVESADKSKVIVRVAFRNIRGQKFHGGDFEMFERIEDAYFMTAKLLGNFFREKTK